MNDSLPPLTDDDLSAHLDGEGGSDIDARLAADPVAADRLDQLRAAAGVLREAKVAPLDPGVVDGLVAGALTATAATVATAATDPIEPDDPGVVPIDGRRRTGPSWLVAAVVLVLVAAGLGLVWSGTRGVEVDDTATSADVAERQVDEAAGGAGSATARAEGADAAPDGDAAADSGSNLPSTTLEPEASLGYTDGGVSLPDLGAFETSEALRSSLALAFPTGAAAKPASSSSGPITESSVERCAGLLREVLPVEGDPSHTGFAQVGGETVLVFEFKATPDHGSTATSIDAAEPLATLTTAVRPAACDPLFVFQR